MILFSVCKKNLISSLRGEYLDFIVSRIAFTLIYIATGYILYNLNSRKVSKTFLMAMESGDYLGYIVVGTALFSTTTGIFLNVSRTLMTERREGTLESVLMIPFQRWQYYGGNQLHQLLLSGVDLIIALAIGAILGIEFNLKIHTTLLGLAQFFTTLYGLALITSIFMILFKDTFFIQNTLLPIVLISGGFIFPIENLPEFLKVLTNIIPIHWGVDLVRKGTLLGLPYEPAIGVIKMFIPGGAMLIIGYLTLPAVERRALEDYLS